MAILCDTDILKARENGEIIIEPFVPENLTNVALDVTLGSDIFFTFSKFSNHPTIDISNKQSIRESWTPGMFSVCNEKKGITVSGGSTVLCHTHEFVGSTSRTAINTMLRARSTLARAGLTVCASSGWGDVGFHNRWALVITNVRNDWRSVFIPFETRVAQIVFLTVTGVPSKSYTEASGHYAQEESNETSFEKMRAMWKPESILP